MIAAIFEILGQFCLLLDTLAQRRTERTKKVQHAASPPAPADPA